MTIPEARGSAFKTVDKCQQVAKVIIQSQNSKFDFLALLEGIKVKGDHDEKKVERHLRFFRVIALLVDFLKLTIFSYTFQMRRIHT